MPEAILHFMEHINMDAPRMAQNLLATRSLRIGGDAGRSWAEVMEEYLNRQHLDWKLPHGLLGDQAFC